MRIRANRVIVVSGGMTGLTTALYLSAAGREVTVLDKRDGLLELDGYRFDVGPAQAWTPRELAEPLRAAGEELRDWIDLEPLDPVCRAHYPDGTTLDVHADRYRTARNIRDLCGGREARAFLRFARLPWVPAGMKDARTLSLRSCAALFGFSPWAMAWHPRGGLPMVQQAFASVAQKRGVNLRLGTSVRRFETRGGRVIAVHTDDGERLPADAFVVPPSRSFAKGPSQLVIHLGTPRTYSKIATHNLHFGRDWRRNREEVLARGEIMHDPTILVTAVEGTYKIVVPVPNLRLAPYDWDGPATRAYTGEIMAILEARGYLDLGLGLRTSYVVTPADWARQGISNGIPSTLCSTLANVVVAGPGIDAGRRAAERVIAI